MTAGPWDDLGSAWWRVRTRWEGPHRLWLGPVSSRGAPRQSVTAGDRTLYLALRTVVARAAGLGESAGWAVCCGHPRCLTPAHLVLASGRHTPATGEGRTAGWSMVDRLVARRRTPVDASDALRAAIGGERLDLLSPVDAKTYAEVRLAAGETPLMIASDSPRAWAMTGRPWPRGLSLPPAWDTYLRQRP